MWVIFLLLSCICITIPPPVQNLEVVSPISNCLSILFPNWNLKWEQHLLYFLQSQKIDETLITPDSSLLPRFLSVTNTSRLRREPYKHSDTFNIVISPLEYDQEYRSLKAPLRGLGETLVPSRTMFIYIWANTPNYNHSDIVRRNAILADGREDVQIFPALKFILALPLGFRCIRDETMVQIICLGYCKQFKPHVVTENFYSVHHELFWDGNGNVIPALILMNLDF